LLALHRRHDHQPDVERKQIPGQEENSTSENKVWGVKGSDLSMEDDPFDKKEEQGVDIHEFWRGYCSGWDRKECPQARERRAKDGRVA